jgi:adenylate cyclase
MDEKLFAELPAWLTQAGLDGTPETEIVCGFCERCVAAGIKLGRVHLFIDTLDPVHEGRMFRWGYGPDEGPVHEYGRTSLDPLAGVAPVSLDQQATDIWRRSAFYNMLQTGAWRPTRRTSSRCCVTGSPPG